MPRSRRLLLFYDYVDPASFLLESTVREILSGGPPQLTLEPFEVRPPPQSLLDPDEPAWRERWDSVVPTWERMGLRLPRPWIVPWTRKAHELAAHARASGCFQDTHDALFRAYLHEGRDIGRVDILVEIGRSCGLDPAETKAVLDVDRYAAGLEAGRAKARAMGILGVPSLVLDGGILSGLPGDEALRAFLESAPA